MSDFGIFLLMFAAIVGLVALIKFLAWVDRVREQGLGVLWSVNTYHPVMSLPLTVPLADEQTDEADRPTDKYRLSVIDMAVEQLEVDRTKTTVIEVLVYNGWTTGEIRAVIKGDNAAIGAEVDAARKRYGIDPPERTLKVRDQAGERVIPFGEPRQINR